MACSPRLAASCLLLLALLTTPATADGPPPWDEPFAPDTAALLAAAQAFEPAQEGARVLLEEQTMTYDEAGRVVERYRKVYRVDDRASVDAWASLVAYWQPWRQERPELDARVITEDGRIWRLDPDTISDEPVDGGASYTVSDARLLRAPLPGVAAGAVVETITVLRSTQTGVGGQDVSKLSFGFYVPSEASRLILDAPEDLPLRWKVHALPDLETETSRADGRRRVSFRHGPLEPWKDAESYLPGDVVERGTVRWSTRESWGAAADLYAREVEPQIAGADLTEAVAAAVAELGPEPAPRAVVDALTAWLHDRVRYTGVQFSEAALIPRPPAQTLDRGYGDCKDKSSLLVALLREAGFEAHLALLLTGPGTDVDPELPGLLGFDHAIVRAPDVGGEEVWIDATAPFHPPGLLPIAAQNRWALPAVPGVPGLVRTPATVAADNRRTITRRVEFADLGDGRLVDTVELTGGFAAFVRGVLTPLNEEDREGQLKTHLGRLFAGAELVSWEIDNLDDLGLPLRYRIEATTKRQVVSQLDSLAVGFDLFEAFSELPDPAVEPRDDDAADGDDEEDDRRRHDLEVLMPFVEELVMEVTAPPGYRQSRLPEEDRRSLGPATYALTRSWEGDRGQVRVVVDSGPRRWSAEDVEAARDAVEELREDNVVIVELESAVHAAVAEGRIVDAVRQARGLATEQPEKGLPRIQLALALLQGGLGEAAWKEARAAVSLEPDSADVVAEAGYVFLHGRLGREFGLDWPRQEALETLRRARELDPENPRVRQNIGVALTRSETGIAFGEGAEVAPAIEEFTYLVDELDWDAVRVNLLQALFLEGHFEQALERARKLPNEANTLAFRLAAATRVHGVEEAIREMPEVNGATRLSAVIAGAGQLLRLGHYRDAVGVLRGGVASLPDANRRVLRSLERLETVPEASWDATDPDAVARWFAELMAADDVSEMAARLFDGLAGDVSADRREEIEEAARAFREGLTQHGASPLVSSRALYRGALDIRREDFPGVGHRMTIGSLLVPEAEQVLYLAEADEPGEPLRWVAYNEGTLESLMGMGVEALRRLGEPGTEPSEADLTAARQWLDWAREVAVSPSFDDPLDGHAIALFWSRGQNADADQARTAAAALLAESPDFADRAVPLLEAARERAVAAEDDRAAHRLDLALLTAYRATDRYEEVLSLADRLGERYPDSPSVLGNRYEALFDLERYDELEAAVTARLERFPDDISALTSALAIPQELEQADRYREVLERAVASSDDVTVSLFANNLSWLDLVEDRVTDDSVDLLRDALRKGPNTFAVHTLASLYAARGQAVEARDLLRKLEDERGWTPEDYLVLGLLAESFGETEAARAAYDRAAEELGPLEDAGFNSTRRLVERRRGALEPDKADTDAG